MKKNDKYNEIIYELRKKGYSYGRISEYLREQGVNLSCCSIRYRCNKIFASLGESLPKIDYYIKKSEEQNEKISDDELIQLRKQGYSYTKISKYFSEKGIKITCFQIKKRCKKILDSSDEKPFLDKYYKSQISDDEIFALKESGMSYAEMAEYYKHKGIKISLSSLSNRCKQIYSSKKLPVPNAKMKKGERHKSTSIIPAEKIYILRNAGLSYVNIGEYLHILGYKCSTPTIRSLCAEYCKNNNLEIPTPSNFERIRISVDDKSLEELESELQELIKLKQKCSKLLKDSKNQCNIKKEENDKGEL